MHDDNGGGGVAWRLLRARRREQRVQLVPCADATAEDATAEGEEPDRDRDRCAVHIFSVLFSLGEAQYSRQGGDGSLGRGV